MKKLTRWLCLAMVLALCLSLIPGAAATESQLGDPTKTTDFVLVLDCSGSLWESDPNLLCLEACSMFVDMIPVENARVSIVAFGYPGDDAYTYSQQYNVKYDRNRVHVIAPLQEPATLKEKDSIKDEIRAAVDKGRNSDDTKTPIGMAVLGAVDMLEVTGASDSNACIILMSDGKLSSTNILNNQESVDAAIVSAKSHNWPVYCLELNYTGANDNDSDYWGARNVLTRLATETGAGETGRMEIKTAADIGNAFQSIFDRFMLGGDGSVEMVTAGTDGSVERQIEIPNLTSETTVVVSGTTLSKLVLADPEGNQREVSVDMEENNLVASVVPGSYFCVKLLCPIPGTWTIRAYGDPNAKFAMYDCSMRDLDLALLSDPVLKEGDIMSKNETITFYSHFAYHGAKVQTNDFYAQKQPTLIVTNTVTGKSYPFPMEAEGNTGYVYKVNLAEVGSGAFEVHVLLEDNMFRNGSKVSESLFYRTENLPVKILSNTMDAITGHVGNEFEKIDLNKYISNPDGDPLEYTLSCVSDRNLVFAYTIDEQGYLYLDCGFVPGTHSLELTVKDPDMASAETLNLSATVVDDPVEQPNPLPQQEIWVDFFSFQGNPPSSATINLADYFFDPENLALTFSNISATTGEEGEELLKATLDGTVLTLEPLSKGDCVVSFSVTDGNNTLESSVEVEVVSGKAVFWAENWIWFALAGAAIFLFVVLMIFLSANKRVKGLWSIEVRENDYIATIENLNIRANTRQGTSKSFKLKDLLNSVLCMMDGSEDFGTSLDLGNQFGQITMVGVQGAKGCSFTNLPAGSSVSVRYQGLPQTRKFRMKSGSVVITVTQQGYDDTDSIVYTITMSVK